jgi:hypothetical protein
VAGAVQHSYRLLPLGRIGRLRTDLGGVYFNAVFIAGMSLAYLTTGAPWLLVAIVALHIETATQFLPMIRLDGYYILSDLVGVPECPPRSRPPASNTGTGTAPKLKSVSDANHGTALRPDTVSSRCPPSVTLADSSCAHH